MLSFFDVAYHFKTQKQCITNYFFQNKLYLLFIFSLSIYLLFIFFLDNEKKTATGFLQVYDMGIDTILISYLFDLKENKKGQYMFSEGLAKAAGKGGQTRLLQQESFRDSEEKGDGTVSSKYVASPEPEKDITKKESTGELI